MKGVLNIGGERVDSMDGAEFMAESELAVWYQIVVGIEFFEGFFN